MTKIEKLKKEIDELEQQLFSLKIKLIDICPHSYVNIDSVTFGSDGNDYDVTCLTCGKSFKTTDLKYSQFDDKPGSD